MIQPRSVVGLRGRLLSMLLPEALS